MDLGTANSIIIHNDKIVVDEPSVVAIENKTDKLIAVGTPAHMMEGRESPGIRTIRPLRDGVIADFNAAEQMIRGMVKMVGSNVAGSRLLSGWLFASRPVRQKSRFALFETRASTPADVTYT